MRNRLRPYGRVLPMFVNRAHLTAWMLGIRDGWSQPYDLSTSTNTEHLWTVDDSPQDSLDAGINLGQWLRSPLNHQQQEV